jgi:hypothetical protein
MSTASFGGDGRQFISGAGNRWKYAASLRSAQNFLFFIEHFFGNFVSIGLKCSRHWTRINCFTEKTETGLNPNLCREDPDHKYESAAAL